jgi:predicted O-methyltransferase YrrM
LLGIKTHIRSILYKQRERLDFYRLPKTEANTSSLRAMTPDEVSSIFLDAAVNSEWPGVSTSIDEIIKIEDMTTAGVNPGDRRCLYYLVRYFKPRRILEIGTNVGASILHIAIATKQNAISDCALVTVDFVNVNDTNAYWKRGGLPRSPRDNIAEIGMSHCVSFVTSTSLGYFDRTSEKFDFIFLDGDHSAATVYQEIPRALDHLAPSGVIILHDFFPNNKPLWRDGSVIPGPFLAVKRLKNEGTGIKVHPLGRLPWTTKLESNVTSLALLIR